MRFYCVLLSFMLVNIVFACDDDTYIDGGREVTIDELSTVSDLHQILNDWSSIQDAIYAYAMGVDRKYFGKCQLKNLSIEHLHGVGRYANKAVVEYYPEYEDSIKGSGVQTLYTQHPCFFDSQDRFITWVFIFKDNKYKVIQQITVM